MDIAELIPKFVDQLKLPAEKPVKLFIVGVIGSIGSGKTTVARALVERLPGSIHVQSDAAHYVLKEHGMPWGENVRALTEGVIRMIVQYGYAVVLDGGAAEAGERDRLAHLATALQVSLMFVRVRCETEICMERTQRKYDDPSWESSFNDFRVNTTDKMVENVRARAVLHHDLDSHDIVGLVGEYDGNQPLSVLPHQIETLVKRIQDQLQ